MNNRGCLKERRSKIVLKTVCIRGCCKERRSKKTCNKQCAREVVAKKDVQKTYTKQCARKVLTKKGAQKRATVYMRVCLKETNTCKKRVPNSARDVLAKNPSCMYV